MVTIVVNAYAHRLVNSGVIESTPVRLFGLPADKVKQIIVPEDNWVQRDPASMNLTGGDYSLIASELERLCQIFADEYSIPTSTPKQQVKPLASESR